MEELWQVLGEKIVADDGCGMYGTYHHIRPQAIRYVGTNDRTYIVYNDVGFDPNILYYDHTTGTLSSAVQIAESPIDDHHSAASLLIDQNGYLHVFYGAHNSALKHAKSDNPEDISSWTVQADVDSEATYPIARVADDGTIYVFFRGRITGLDGRIESMRVSNDNGATWGPRKDIIDFSSDYNDGVYHGQVILGSESPTQFIHIIWTWFDESAATRHNVYYAYSPDGGDTWYAKNGTDLGATITKDEADANCLVYDSTGDPPIEYLDGNYVTAQAKDLRLDASNEPLILFSHSIAGGQLQWCFAKWNSETNSWDVYNITTTTVPLQWGSLDHISSNDIEAYLITGGTEAHVLGKNLELWKSVDGGVSWSLAKTIVGDVNCSNPQLVNNYSSDLKVVWSYGEFSATPTSGDIYAYGDAMEAEAYALFWVKVPSIPASPNGSIIYLYYGKPDLTTTSNGENTFPWLFDDLEAYAIGDPPNSTDWATEGTGASDTITVQQDPVDASKKCFRIVESGDGTNTILFALLKGYRGGFAFHFRLRGDTDERWYFQAKEDDTFCVNIQRNYLEDRFQWYDGAAYQEFSPQLSAPINTWLTVIQKIYDTGKTYMHWNVDGVEYAGGWWNAPVNGMNKLGFQTYRLASQILYIGGVGTDGRYIFARKFVDPEPSHGVWGAEETV